MTGRGPGGVGPGRDARDVPRDALRDSPLRRLLLLLESFDPQHDELTLTELSKRSGLPLTTTHRMIGELTSAGVLERTAAGRYHVGLRLWETAALAPRALGIRETAFPFLEDLFLATRENVLLAVRDGDEMVFVERLSAPRAIPVSSFLGRRRSLHASSAGLGAARVRRAGTAGAGVRRPAAPLHLADAGRSDGAARRAGPHPPVRARHLRGPHVAVGGVRRRAGQGRDRHRHRVPHRRTRREQR